MKWIVFSKWAGCSLFFCHDTFHRLQGYTLHIGPGKFNFPVMQADNVPLLHIDAFKLTVTNRVSNGRGFNMLSDFRHAGEIIICRKIALKSNGGGNAHGDILCRNHTHIFIA